MEIKKRYILLFLVVLAGAWLLQNKAIEHIGNQKYSASFRQIRNIGKIGILDQDFLLHNMDSLEKAYPFMANVVVSGRLGFDIDLADSTHTSIEAVNDTIVISAPVRISHISHDIITTQTINDMVTDTSIHVNKAAVLKILNQQTLAQCLPLVIPNLKYRDLVNQQIQLTNVTGTPVKIILTQMPTVNSWHN